MSHVLLLVVHSVSAHPGSWPV